jgi:hypothetical protein
MERRHYGQLMHLAYKEKVVGSGSCYRKVMCSSYFTFLEYNLGDD